MENTDIIKEHTKTFIQKWLHKLKYLKELALDPLTNIFLNF